MATITGANAVLTLSVQDLFPSGVTIQGFSTDDAFRSEAITQAEILMGVDGILSAGFVFNPYKMTIALQADSPSVGIFEEIRLNQEASVDLFRIDGTIFLPGISTQYALTNGYMTSSFPFSDVKKVLQPRTVEITFQSITSEPSAI